MLSYRSGTLDHDMEIAIISKRMNCVDKQVDMMIGFTLEQSKSLQWETVHWQCDFSEQYSTFTSDSMLFESKYILYSMGKNMQAYWQMWTYIDLHKNTEKNHSTNNAKSLSEDELGRISIEQQLCSTTLC